MEMDYKKLYEQAFEKIKDLYDNYDEISCLVDMKQEFEKAFPQLKESDDERIRKKIVELVKKHAVNAERCQMEDWLEKQDPKKHEEELDKAYKCADEVQYRKGYEDAKRELEKQGEKYSVWVGGGEVNAEYLTLNEAKTLAEFYKTDGYSDVVIKPQPHCEYNPYKVTIKSILEMCARYDNTLTCDKQDFLDNVRVKCKDAIEYDNLYPQSHWKPTEEQMNALKIVKNGFPADDLDAIESLYEQLKKL